MNERELKDLAAYVELPAEHDLAPAVRARLGARRPLPGKLVIAVALVILAIAIAFAVPPARGEILRWLGLGTARVEYDVVTSKLLGTPREVHLLGDQVGFVYGNRKLVVTQSRGTFFTKEVGPGTHVERLSVDGLPAYWISGAPHFFGYVAANGRPHPIELYLARNALIGQRGDVTLRLEGELSRADALRVARSFG